MAAVAEALQDSYSESRVDRWQGGRLASQPDLLAEEVPVALVYNDIPHAVMLATPVGLHDFALGFSLTERIIDRPEELRFSAVLRHVDGIEIRMIIAPERAAHLTDRSRNLAGRTGCGLCGARMLEDAVRKPAPVGKGVTVTASALALALRQLRERQGLHRLTGSVHATAWVLPEGGVQVVREDVGRHNALDKLIGTLARSGTDFESGFVVITSRASYELVQKCAMIGITFLAAISAPTALAVRLARATGVTLIGFARGENHVIYSHPSRLIHASETG